MRTVTLSVVSVLCVFLQAQAAIQGTRSIGPTGDYASLTAAIADVQTQTLDGPLVLELQPTYLSTVETFPLVLSNLSTTATNTLTIRPTVDATALSISSAATQTVSLNGAQFVTIDGRPGGLGSTAGSGVGTASQLTIANTSTGGVALRFINEASGNNVRYSTLRGVNTSSASGTVVFSTTTGANGNDNNTLDHCDLRDGASTPANGLYSLGTTSTTARNNSGNSISNCNVFDFYAGTSAGVRLDSGNTDWTISGNSFYQTATRAAVAANVRAIYVNNSSGNNFTVTGNFIGGSAASAGGTAWMTTGPAAAYLFQGIALNVGSISPSSVQGNVIDNMVWTTNAPTATLPGGWIGIYVQAGRVGVGTVTGNTIGSGTGNQSISLNNASAGGGTCFGVGSTSSDSVAIANNTIGSISANGSAVPVFASIIGIQVTAGANTISNNTVGSTVTPNSLSAGSWGSSGVGQVSGILSSSSTSTTITGNTVANLSSNYTGGGVRGIDSTAGVNTITGNTVRNLSTTSQNTGFTTSQSVLGIVNASTAERQTVSQNTVYSLTNTAVSASVGVTGIFFSGPTTGTNVIARNFIHSLAISSTSPSSRLTGIEFLAGTFTAQNNMVSLGLDADGFGTASAAPVRGIFDNAQTPGRNFYHNSIYIGGTQTSGTAHSAAFVSVGASNARTFRNNIFVNARSASGSATGDHCAVVYVGTNFNGLSAGGNLFFTSGTRGLLGLAVFTRCTTLAAWQTATGQDATSAVANPLFVAPYGDASTVDLHLQASNPAEGGGVALAGAPVSVADDFDGQPRTSLSPADVGADAANFTLTSDVFAPSISYPLLTSGSTANRVLTGWATIVDNASGGVSGGVNAPRLYFKKSTDADVFGGNTSADNGWKYVTATGSGPAYSFTLDYTLINGGSVSVGDTVQYFVVAQDAANNLGSSPVGATSSANPPVRNVNGHGAVSSFSIVGTLSGTKTVGTGGDYPSLSGTGGLFAALNASVLAGNLVVNITSDLTETGGVSLNEFLSNEYPASGTYALTIQPDSATMRTISGTATAGLITLNGADGVTIDGRFGGGGRYLTFRNAMVSGFASTVLFINDATGNSVRHCIVEGGTGASDILFSTGTVTGNNNNLITGCQVRDLSNLAGVPQNLIFSQGTSDSVPNTGNSVSSNELFNFSVNAVFVSATGNASWTISNNNIYEANASPISPTGIQMNGRGTNVIAGNHIHDLQTTGSSSLAIASNGFSTTSIVGNRITSFNVGSAPTSVYAIEASGSAGSVFNVVNNQVSLIPVAPGRSYLYGILDKGATGSVLNVFNNSVVIGGTDNSNGISWACLRNTSNGSSTHTSRNNLFLNVRTGGTGSHFAVGIKGSGGSYTFSNNVYAGTGAAAASFMEFSDAPGSTVPVSYATWQSITGDTSASAGNPGGNYSTAMFVNAPTGDLHLVPGGNVLVNARGTPIVGVTDDFDGDLRSPTTPMIGADEVQLPDIAVTQLSPVTDGASIDFGNVIAGSSSTKTFTITNLGGADLTGLAITKDGPNAADFTVSALSGTSVPVGNGSVTFTVTFAPGGGQRDRVAALHITSNVLGPKNPFDIDLTGFGPRLFQAWAAAKNVVANDSTLLNFAFNTAPGSRGELAFDGTFAGGGTIKATGTPITMIEQTTNSTDIRVVFVRRKDYELAGLTYALQFSEDLVTWYSDTGSVPTVLADDGVNQIVSVQYADQMPSAKRAFFRVEVSIAP